MKNERDIASIAMPEFSIVAKNEKRKGKKGVYVSYEGAKEDVFFGLAMIIECLVKNKDATEKEIREVVDLVFIEEEEFEKEFLKQLQEFNKYLDDIAKKIKD